MEETRSDINASFRRWKSARSASRRARSTRSASGEPAGPRGAHLPRLRARVAVGLAARVLACAHLPSSEATRAIFSLRNSSSLS